MARIWAGKVPSVQERNEWRITLEMKAFREFEGRLLLVVAY